MVFLWRGKIDGRGLIPKKIKENTTIGYNNLFFLLNVGEKTEETKNADLFPSFFGG
ncbi:MAG: hypothetical protein Q8N57_02610 [bacterium]|nr:hypothetical protein [bacterium]